MNKKKSLDKNKFKSLIWWVILIVLGILFYNNFVNQLQPGVKRLSYTEFVKSIDTGKIKKVEIRDKEIKGELTDNSSFITYIPDDPNLIDRLLKSKIEVAVKPPEQIPWWLNLILTWAPFILLFLLIFFSARQMQGGAGAAFSFGKSRAKLLTSSLMRVTFDDVAGVDEAKEELKEIIEFLKEPQKFQKLGGRIPKGVLLLGPPGAGKTLLARAVAGEAQVPFFSISGSDFVEMFVGVGASVTGDTPVLVKRVSSSIGYEEIKLVQISEFIDRYYSENEEGFTVKVEDIETLGFTPAVSNFRGAKDNSKTKFFGSSSWQKISAVYRHRVKEICEIHYLGGVIKATADHSIFVRKRNLIMVKKAIELKKGDILVGLPFKVRSKFLEGIGTTHKVKAHNFQNDISIPELKVWEDDKEMVEKYEFAMASSGKLSQSAIASSIDVSQATVGNWQRGEYMPRDISKKLSHADKIPQKVNVTPELMKVFGYYTAEGRCNNSLEFVFGKHEKELHQDCQNIIKEIFNLDASLEETSDNTLGIRYGSATLGRFFVKYCSNGSHNKHIPYILWNMPKEYFLSYLEGYSKGDEYISKEDKLVVSSVSKQLIIELAWLCSMHGIPVGIEETKCPGGRIIRNKPLPETIYWRLTIGKTSNPFVSVANTPVQMKKPRVEKVVIKQYDGFVYDLCGCEGEAFFGGDKPILLHNSRVRDLFEQGKKSAPCIIFIDELDAVGRHRGAGIGGGHDEREQTLNQLLVEMDGFAVNTGVILIAATNRPDVLDPALLRPGRFDRHIVVDNPDVVGREGILKVHTRKIPLAPDVDLKVIARGTPGFSGADLANLVNEAALLAARRNKKQVEISELEEAKDRVMMGPERKSRIIGDREKRSTAFHEAGHALVSKLIPGSEPVHKVTIIPRGRSLGSTFRLPTEDRYNRSKSEFLNDIAIFLGGRAAEELIMNELTTGARNDLEIATDIAHKMVCEYGMSDELGPRTFGKRDQEIFIGRDLLKEKNYSEETSRKIDDEVKKIIDTCYEKAKMLLKDNKEKLEKLANALLEREVLDGAEVDKIVV